MSALERKADIENVSPKTDMRDLCSKLLLSG
jgi:hypothetical protein